MFNIYKLMQAVKMAQEGGAEQPAGGAANSLITDDAGQEGQEQEQQQDDGQQQQEVEGQEQKQATDRPEWLPEGYEKPEDLAKAHAELLEKTAAFTGAPESGEYELTLSEGQEGFTFFEHEKGDIKSFMNIAKEMNMSQEAFQKLLGLYVDSKIVQDEQNLVERQRATLEFVGGQKELATINAKAKAKLTPDQFKLLQHAASTAPDAAGAAIMLVNSLALGGETNPITRVPQSESLKTKGELREMMKDPRYKSDPEYRKQILEGFEALEKQGNK